MPLRNITGRDPLYEYISPLGRGGFGTVVKVRRLSDSKIMACKTIDCSSHPSLKQFAEREIDACASLSHEKYIAKFSNDWAWSTSTDTVRIYMDYYEGGDLQRVIDISQFEGAKVHPVMAAYWALEIARAVKICHDRGIIHRDIKPQNVLLSTEYKVNEILWNASSGRKLEEKDKSSAQGFMKWMESRTAWCHLTDFGLGKFSEAAMMASRHTIASFGMVGTPGYIAPESMTANPVFSAKSDVYSLGCLIYALSAGKSPSRDGIPNTSGFLAVHYPRRMENLIKRCLAQNPSDRPTSREVVDELSEVFLDIMNGEFWAKTKNGLQPQQTPVASAPPARAPPQNAATQPAKPAGFLGAVWGRKPEPKKSPVEDFMAEYAEKERLKTPEQKQADKKEMDEFMADYHRKEALKSPAQKAAERKELEQWMADLQMKQKEEDDAKRAAEFWVEFERKEKLKSPAQREAEKKQVDAVWAKLEAAERLKTPEQKLADKKAMEKVFGKKYNGFW